MIEAVFLFVAYMNGSQTITPIADMETCKGLERVVRQSAGTNSNVPNALRVEPTVTRCVTINGAKSAAPAKE